ncbi:MAG TPA: CPBP family intramembrane glutamic endopeptidase [Anaerolineae bacterium]|nr:CPBP family intramembrane glutamic endopeptidase [Anaerolineae bacterium]
MTLGLGLAFVFFALTFRGPRSRFWQRMTGTGLALGGLALAAEPRLRRTRFGWRDLLIGLGSAGFLYGVFQIGDRLARLILPKGGAEINAIYGLESLRPRNELAARLALIIGPAEELFWRGLIQERLMRRYGIAAGYALGAAAYGGAHLVTGNLTLIAAATVAGAFWGLLAALGAPPGALIVSHSAWDVFIFLVAPTVKSAASRE